MICVGTGACAVPAVRVAVPGSKFVPIGFGTLGVAVASWPILSTVWADVTWFSIRFCVVAMVGRMLVVAEDNADNSGEAFDRVAVACMAPVNQIAYTEFDI